MRNKYIFSRKLYIIDMLNIHIKNFSEHGNIKKLKESMNRTLNEDSRWWINKYDGIPIELMENSNYFGYIYHPDDNPGEFIYVYDEWCQKV